MADRKSIRKPPCNPPPGHLTEEQLKAETGASKYRLDDWGDKLWGEKGLVPRIRVGRFWFYPEIAIKIVRCIQASPDKDTDELRLTLWSEGFDHIDIFRFINRRLASRSKKLVKATPDQIEQVKKEAIRSGGRLRGKPLQPICSRVRSQTARKTLLDWAIDIVRGIVPTVSLYDHSDKSALLTKVIGGVPDLELDIENMSSLDRLCGLINNASAAEREQDRQDYARLTNTIASVPRPVRIVEPYASLIRSWHWLDVRIVFVPFMIDLRRRGYGEELEKFLRDFEGAVAAITLRRDTPQDGELPPHFHRTPAGSVWRPEVLIDIPDGPVDYSFGDPPTMSFDTYLDAFEVSPGLPAIHFRGSELHAYNA